MGVDRASAAILVHVVGLECISGLSIVIIHYVSHIMYLFIAGPCRVRPL